MLLCFHREDMKVRRGGKPHMSKKVQHSMLMQGASGGEMCREPGVPGASAVFALIFYLPNSQFGVHKRVTP